jgi:hypothetical protein
MEHNSFKADGWPTSSRGRRCQTEILSSPPDPAGGDDDVLVGVENDKADVGLPSDAPAVVEQLASEPPSVNAGL